MALSAKLMLRQGHALVMTPQLLQAIKLLQFSNVELCAFVDSEVERNPLLERDDNEREPDVRTAAPTPIHDENDPEFHADWSHAAEPDAPRGEPAASASESPASDFSEAASLDVQAPSPGTSEADSSDGYSSDAWSAAPSAWSSQPSSGGGGLDDISFEALAPAQKTLREHLSAQLGLALVDPVDRLIGQAIVDSIDDSGYLADPVEEIADRIGVRASRAERVLRVVQGFEPSGVGARDLAECIAIQLRELDRFDPAMKALVERLPLLARKDFAALEKICGVDAEDVAAMAAEIRRLDPKPGRAFGTAPVQTIIPDVIVRAAADGGWRIELNPETLPRVLVNQKYAAQIVAKANGSADKTFIAGCLQDANWLTKSLDQRARTILKVSSEIVRQQDAFFTHGVEHLRPLNLKMVADAVGMHESTVSRVTSNKYIGSPRGLFELKYFFSASIASKSGSEAHSAEAVRHRIKQLIEHEDPGAVLSDDAIVDRLRSANIDIARRTVAKYRESMRIPSSVERRREKLARARI